MGLALVVAVGSVAVLAWEAMMGTSKTSAPGKPVTPAKKGSPGVDFPAPSGDKPQTSKPHAHDPRVDANMPAPLVAVTVKMLDDPNATAGMLNAAAAAAELAGFPIAAASLRAKADSLGGGIDEGPPQAGLQPGSPAALAADFAAMDDPPRSEVMSALATSNDADFLDRQADEAEAGGFEEVAAAFRAKANLLQQSHGGMVPHIPGMVPDKPGGNPDFPGGGNVPGASAQQIAAAFAMGAKATADMSAANAAGSGQLAFVAAQEAAQAVAMQTAVNQALLAAGQPPVMFPPIGVA